MIFFSDDSHIAHAIIFSDARPDQLPMNAIIILLTYHVNRFINNFLLFRLSYIETVTN